MKTWKCEIIQPQQMYLLSIEQKLVKLSVLLSWLSLPPRSFRASTTLPPFPVLSLDFLSSAFFIPEKRRQLRITRARQGTRWIKIMRNLEKCNIRLRNVFWSFWHDVVDNKMSTNLPTEQEEVNIQSDPLYPPRSEPSIVPELEGKSEVNGFWLILKQK